jgi:hypothetical protein
VGINKRIEEYARSAKFSRDEDHFTKGCDCLTKGCDCLTKGRDRPARAQLRQAVPWRGRAKIDTRL